jgi:hypothetical protein
MADQQPVDVADLDVAQVSSIPGAAYSNATDDRLVSPLFVSF